MEARPDGAGGAAAVIGVGINVCMPPDALDLSPIEQAWTDVRSQVPGPLAPDFRDRLCGLVLDDLLRGLELFASQEFAAFAADWARLDLLHGRAVDINIADPTHATVSGTAAGISHRGGLLVCCPGPCGKDTVLEFLAGDVSLRLC